MMKIDERDILTATDWQGHQYMVLSVVLYPRMSGRSVEMVRGIVRRIYEKNTGPRTTYDYKTGVTKKHTAYWELRVVVEPTSSSRDFHRTKVDGKVNTVTIKITDNITAI